MRAPQGAAGVDMATEAANLKAESFPMSKPPALSEEALKDIEMRLVKGWVVRRDQTQALIAMARERNAMLEGANAKPGAQQANTYTV